MSTSSKSPFRLAGKLLLLTVALLLSYFALLYLCNRCDRYLAAQLDKLELLRTTASPRLVLLGGSNLAFGIDSALLERAAGMPVVNMGLNSGFGLKYLLDAARPHLRKGDVVLVVPEYHNFFGSQFEGEDALLNLFLIQPEFEIFKRLRPAMVLSDNQVIFRFKPLKYLRERGVASFNRYGDEISHLGKQSVLSGEEEPFDTRLNEQALDYLCGFLSECQGKGIRALFVFPCLAKTNFRVNGALIGRVESALRQRTPYLAPFRPGDFVYDDWLFYDSIYHLDAEGRRMRTEQIATIFRARK